MALTRTRDPFYDRTLDSFADDIIVRVHPGTDNPDLWYAVLDIGPTSFPSDPDFSTCAGNREDAIRLCAMKIRDDAKGIGEYAPHPILTGYGLHCRLMRHWDEKERVATKPPSVVASNPQVGDRIRFRYEGQWVPGVVAGEGTELRLPVHRTNTAVEKMRRRIYWRNRTQIYQP